MYERAVGDCGEVGDCNRQTNFFFVILFVKWLSSDCNRKTNFFLFVILFVINWPSVTLAFYLLVAWISMKKRSKPPKLHTDNNDMSRIVKVLILFDCFWLSRSWFFHRFSFEIQWPSLELDHHHNINHRHDCYQSGNHPQALEKVYKTTDWPPTYTGPAPQQSLRDSGKSRADLWAFAG